MHPPESLHFQELFRMIMLPAQTPLTKPLKLRFRTARQAIDNHDLLPFALPDGMRQRAGRDMDCGVSQR